MIHTQKKTRKITHVSQRLLCECHDFALRCGNAKLVAGGGLLGGIVDDLPRLEPSPLVTLNIDAQGEEHRGDNQNLHTHALAVVHLGLSSPVEELNNILGHLGGGGGGAILVVDEAVVEDTGHGDTGTGEVGVEVKAGANGSASGRLIGIAGKEGEDVVAATVAGLDNQAEIGRKGTVVGETGGLIVLVGIGEVVGKLAGALLDLALVVGLGVVLVLFGKSLGLIDGQDGADKSAVGDSAERVARGADLTVHLETSAKTAVGQKQSHEPDSHFEGEARPRLGWIGVVAYAW